MKKLLSIGMLTVCALAFSEHQAQAWVNSKFSIGLNWHIQSANNNVLWGLWRNGQVPGPEAFGQQGGPGPAYFAPGPGPYMPPASNGNFPFFGGAPAGYPAPLPQGFPPQTSPPPMTAQQQAFGNYQYNPYQMVSYQPLSNYYVPSYYYPAYNPGYGYQVPSYWYQGR
jgi:hypothetical protein